MYELDGFIIDIGRPAPERVADFDLFGFSCLIHCPVQMYCVWHLTIYCVLGIDCCCGSHVLECLEEVCDAVVGKSPECVEALEFCCVGAKMDVEGTAWIIVPISQEASAVWGCIGLRSLLKEVIFRSSFCGGGFLGAVENFENLFHIDSPL